MSLTILSNLAFCTFSTSRIMVREVLEDWFTFLGGKPKQVIFAVSPCDNPPRIYEELRVEGLIDQIIYLEPNGRSVGEINPEGLRVAITAAKTDWVLLAKLDTLPWREGHENWLSEAMRAVEHYNCLGLTSSAHNYYNLQPAEQGYSKTQKFSDNFSIIRREDWLNIQDTYVGRNFDGHLVRDPKFAGEELRFVDEAAIETFLEENQRYMLVPWESLQWSVFHVNVWGEQLRQVRELYIARKGVTPYLFTGKPHDRSKIHPWDMYYGYPKPSWFKRVRIWLGRWRREMFKV
jgi:hypothetical protein